VQLTYPLRVKGEEEMTTENRVTQYCIEAVRFEDALSMFRSTMKIKNLSFTLGTLLRKNKLDVPERLQKMGVFSGRMHDTAKEWNGTFQNLTKKEMRKRMQSIAKHTGVDIKSARINHVTIQVNGTEAVFHRVKKEIRVAEDKRKKVAVLGLTSHKGPIDAITSTLNLAKYACQMTTQEAPKKVIVCTKVG